MCLRFLWTVSTDLGKWAPTLFTSHDHWHHETTCVFLLFIFFLSNKALWQAHSLQLWLPFVEVVSAYWCLLSVMQYLRDIDDIMICLRSFSRLTFVCNCLMIAWIWSWCHKCSANNWKYWFIGCWGCSQCGVYWRCTSFSRNLLRGKVHYGDCFIYVSSNI